MSVPQWEDILPSEAPVEEAPVEWTDVIATEEFQGMDETDREQVRSNYVEQVLKPEAKKAGVDSELVVTNFFDVSKDDVYTPIETSAEDAVPEMLGSKSVGAFFTGMGQGMTEVTRGIQQLVGVKEEELAQEEQMMNELYATEFGDAAFAGRITGALAEPIGLVLPFARGQSLAKAAAIGAGVGGTYGSMLYVDENSDRLTNAAFGAVTGGVLSPTLIAAGRKVNSMQKAAEVRSSNAILDSYETAVHNTRKQLISEATRTTPAGNKIQTLTNFEAEQQARRLLSGTYPEGDLTQALLKSGRTLNTKAEHITMLEQQAADALANRNVVMKGLGKLGEKLEPALSPISTSLKQRSGRLFQMMRKHDATTHIKTTETFKKVNPFLDEVEKLPTSTQDSLYKALLSGDGTNINRYLKLNPKLQSTYKTAREALDGVYDGLRSVGYDIPKLKHYWPRVVVDKEAVGVLEQGILQKTVKKLRDKKGQNYQPSLHEINKALNNVILKDNRMLFGRTSGSLQKRGIDEIDDALLSAYAKPREGIHSYIQSNVADIQRRRLFAKAGVKTSPRKDGGDLSDSIATLTRREGIRKGWDAATQAKVMNILTDRFTTGEQAPARSIAAFKNVMYGVTLGNPVSAMTQFGDLAIAANKHGIKNVAMSLFGKKLVRKEMLGLEDAIEELVSTQKSKTFTDWALKWGGFKAVDKLGKETALNASLRKWNKAMGSTKGRQQFMKEWGQYFEGETRQLMDDLASKKLTDNVKLLLWHELADMQPISLSEMPSWYLKYPNGRIAYMLKSFTVKQLDIMRRHIWNLAAKGDYNKAALNAAKFASLFVMANSTTDAAKDVLRGREINMEDHLVDNVWALVGLNKYTVEGIPRKGLGTSVAQFAMPPISLMDDVARSATDPKRMWNLIPPYGKLIKGWVEDDRDQYFNTLDDAK